MAKKVIDKFNDGWQTEVGDDGQIQLEQVAEEAGPGHQLTAEELVARIDKMLADDEDVADSDDDVEDPDEDLAETDVDEESPEDDDSSSEPRSSYVSYGTYKNNCIVCGDEFQTSRSHSKFCKKPGCRQKFNRQERHVKELKPVIEGGIHELVVLLKDKYFGKLAGQLLLSLEKSLLAALDEVLPERHPPKQVTAIPVLLYAKDAEPGEKLYAFLPGLEEQPFAIEFKKLEGNFIHCYQGGSNGYQRYDRPVFVFPITTRLIRIVDPGDRA